MRTQFIVFVFPLFSDFILHILNFNSFMYSPCESHFRFVLKLQLLHPPRNSIHIVFKSISNACAIKFLHMYLLYKCIKYCRFVYLILHSWLLSTNDSDTHLYCTFSSTHLIYLCWFFLKNCKYIKKIFSDHGGMWYLWIHKYILKPFV